MTVVNQFLDFISTKSLDLAFRRYNLVDKSSCYFDHSKGVVYNNFGSEYNFMFGVKLRSRDVVPCKSNRLNYCWFDIDSEEFPYTIYFGFELPNGVNSITYGKAKGLFFSTIFAMDGLNTMLGELYHLFNGRDVHSLTVKTMFSNNSAQRYALNNDVLTIWKNNRLYTVMFGKVSQKELNDFVTELCRTYLRVDAILDEGIMFEVKSVSDDEDAIVNIVECPLCGRSFNAGFGPMVCPDCLES